MTDSQTSSLEDLKHLRRVVDDIPGRLWAVAIIGFWERFAFWGLTAPWRTLQLPNGEGQCILTGQYRKLHGKCSSPERWGTRSTGTRPSHGNKNILRVLHLLLCHTALFCHRIGHQTGPLQDFVYQRSVSLLPMLNYLTCLADYSQAICSWMWRFGGHLNRCLTRPWFWPPRTYHRHDTGRPRRWWFQDDYGPIYRYATLGHPALPSRFSSSS